MRKYTFQNKYFFVQFWGTELNNTWECSEQRVNECDNKSVHCIQGKNETVCSLENNRQKMRGSWDPGQLSQREWVDFLCLGGIAKTTYLRCSVGLRDFAVSQRILYAVVWWWTVRESCRLFEWGNLSGGLWEGNWLTTINPSRRN